MRRLVAALLVVLASCKIQTHSSSSGFFANNGEPDVRKGVYGECSSASVAESNGRPIRVLQTPYSGGDKQRFWKGDARDLDWPVDEQILRMICVHESIRGDAVLEQHAMFDDRHYDHVAAALMILDCVESGLCDLEERPLAVGMMSWYVENTDLEQVDQQLAGMAGLKPKARQFFLQRVAEAGRQVSSQAAGLDPRRRHLYVAVPAKVRGARRSYFKQNADLYARLDAVIAHAEENRKKQRVTAAIYQALEKLRAEYLQSCAAAECRFDPFFTEITRELALLHLAGRDPIGVLAENALLRVQEANRNGYGQSIYRAQRAALEKESEDWSRYQRALREGVDQSAVVASFGGTPPVQVSSSEAWYVAADFPDFAAAVRDDKYTTVEQTVKSVSALDEIATLTLSYGDPIYVPADEASGVKSGESCLAVIDRQTRDGLIVSCAARGKITQLRGSRVQK